MIIFDLQSPGYPPFENPYSMDIHDSEVSYCGFEVDVSPDIVPALYKAGMRQRQNAFSPREWPIKGGISSQTLCSYSQLIITGHRNGLLKFWDASGVQLQILYLLNVSKLFQSLSEAKRRPQSRIVPSEQGSPSDQEHSGETKERLDDVPLTPTNEQPPQALSHLISNGAFAVNLVALSESGQVLAVGGVGFTILYRLNESSAETAIQIVEARLNSALPPSPHPSVSSQQEQQQQHQQTQEQSQQPPPIASRSSIIGNGPVGPQVLLYIHVFIKKNGFKWQSIGIFWKAFIMNSFDLKLVDGLELRIFTILYPEMHFCQLNFF